MVSWIIVGVLLFVLVLVLKIKSMGHRRERYYITGLILILLFLYISSSLVFQKNNVSLKTFEGVVEAGKIYFSWLGGVFNNAKVIVGHALNMNWDVNSTN